MEEKWFARQLLKKTNRSTAVREQQGQPLLRSHDLDRGNPIARHQTVLLGTLQRRFLVQFSATSRSAFHKARKGVVPRLQHTYQRGVRRALASPSARRMSFRYATGRKGARRKIFDNTPQQTKFMADFWCCWHRVTYLGLDPWRCKITRGGMSTLGLVSSTCDNVLYRL
jgi:hypothetical protein